MKADDAVVRDFLDRARVARLATRSPKGAAALAPVWFVQVAGRLYSATGRDTVAARNAAANPDVVVLLDDGERGPVLRLRGRATVRPGAPPAAVTARFGRKYYLGGWRSELSHARSWFLRTRYYGQSAPATIVVEPGEAELLRRP
ncbi:MAG: pyridoxamine 5'-phosphate oxidase family protein [Rhodococcus ruber]|nr:pyridoxamine 5'-phosphate oxidase family protein [Rhodococcus ruber]